MKTKSQCRLVVFILRFVRNLPWLVQVSSCKEMAITKKEDIQFQVKTFKNLMKLNP